MSSTNRYLMYSPTLKSDVVFQLASHLQNNDRGVCSHLHFQLSIRDFELSESVRAAI